MPREQSIQTAYRETIEKAQHFIYIENQFFITATGDQQKPVENQIGASIVSAVLRAHKEGRKFRIIIVIPAIPGFVGDLRSKEALGTRAIIDFQYKSINRGEHSIFGQLKRKGVPHPEEYIFVFNLRTYDRIHTTDHSVNRPTATGINGEDFPRDTEGSQMRTDGTEPTNAPPAEDTAAPAGPAQDSVRAEDSSGPVQDTIAKDAVKDGKRVADESWDGKEDQEKHDFYQEELYVHAKVMIVDDETLIVGSSNINDRSQLGDHDSELSAIVKHRPTVSALRKQLWMEHLGLLPPQLVRAADDDVNCQPVGMSPNHSDPDPIVEDPLSAELWEMWTSRANKNTEIYRELFHADPDDCSKWGVSCFVWGSAN